MNSRHSKTLYAIFNNPIPKNMLWSRVEKMLMHIGCEIIEGDGSRVAFEMKGRRADFHRPHPGKEALAYQLKAVREFLKQLGVKP